MSSLPTAIFMCLVEMTIFLQWFKLPVTARLCFIHIPNTGQQNEKLSWLCTGNQYWLKAQVPSVLCSPSNVINHLVLTEGPAVEVSSLSPAVRLSPWFPRRPGPTCSIHSHPLQHSVCQGTAGHSAHSPGADVVRSACAVQLPKSGPRCNFTGPSSTNTAVPQSMPSRWAGRVSE